MKAETSLITKHQSTLSVPLGDTQMTPLEMFGISGNLARDTNVYSPAANK